MTAEGPGDSPVDLAIKPPNETAASASWTLIAHNKNVLKGKGAVPQYSRGCSALLRMAFA
jgi:hypothetical protein